MRPLAVPALLLTILALTAAPALAAPSWSIAVTSQNPFGGSTFARQSGGNAYTITVTNTGGSLQAGDTLSCPASISDWQGAPLFGYQWLRNGVAISEATSATYTLVAADEGTAIQCQVTGTNAAGAAVATLIPPAVVPPVPSTAPPIPGAVPSVEGEAEAGHTLSCEPYATRWSGSPSFAYQWLRNGVVISGATSATYTLVAADEGTAIQCQVTGTNAGGGSLVDSEVRVISPVPSPRPPEPAASASQKFYGQPVSVADQLPEGIVPDTIEALSGAGWACRVATLTCTRSDLLAPGASYPPITLYVHVNSEAPDTATNITAVYGGGASPPSATAHDPTTITSAVPFGIESFTTAVTDALGNLFTQAGGHPFAASTSIFLDTTTSDVGIGILGLVGQPKDLEVGLPPGFIGDPQAVPQCPVNLLPSPNAFSNASRCPPDSAVGFVSVALGGTAAGGPTFEGIGKNKVYNLAPTPGHAAEFGFLVDGKTPVVLYGRVRSNGDYGLTVGDPELVDQPEPLAVKLTFCESGVNQEGSGFASTYSCTPVEVGSKPFLTNPTDCAAGPLVTTARLSSYEQPEDYASKEATSPAVTGCNLLQFNPEVQFKPSTAAGDGTSQADEPTGATFNLKVPQTDEAGTNATPELKNATVMLPEGMTVDPSAANGLQACSNAQFGLGSTAEPVEPASCPLASQIGTVKLTTPLLEKPLEGQVFLGEPECSPCTNTDAADGHLFRLFVQVHSEALGVTIKFAGKVSANPTTGRLQATFTEQPQLPFSELLLTVTGGARASLANPQTCGTFTTTTDLTPWSAPETPDATPSSSFNVDWNGAGGTCPGSLPFSPSFSAGSQTPTAGASSPFSVTFGREDREQDISAVTVSTPPGLLGEVSQVPRCPEAQANAGTCGAESEIGSTTVGAGPGPHPFYLGGRVYLTGPYKGGPFGLSIVVPAVAGPFNLGNVIVRAAIHVDPSTAALTIASDPLPQFVDGVQLRLRRINVEVNRPGFVLNPTNCAAQAVGATITAAQGASSTVSTPFEVGGCQSLPFLPSFIASTQANTSKANGASLTVTVKSAMGQANIAKVDLQLPKALPSRLTTLQKACLEAQFNANPAGCPAASDIGTARAITPILDAPLTGPAYLVSHGGAAFPDVEFVLQGEGITLVLDGKTDIKKGLTYSRFEAIPDAPISLFETSLPEGPHSVLATNLPANANGSMCGQSLTLPTIITAQNGKQVKKTTKIAVTGCKASKPPTRAQLLAKALKACNKKQPKKKRASCARKARKKYGPKAKKAKRGGN